MHQYSGDFVTAAIVLLLTRRPVGPGAYEGMATCFLQNPQNKRVGFYFFKFQVFLASAEEELEKEKY